MSYDSFFESLDLKLFETTCLHTLKLYKLGDNVPCTVLKLEMNTVNSTHVEYKERCTLDGFLHEGLFRVYLSYKAQDCGFLIGDPIVILTDKRPLLLGCIFGLKSSDKRLEISAQSILSTLNRRTIDRVFLDVSLGKIVETLISEASTCDYIHLVWRTPYQNKILRYVVQYRENHWQLLQRLLTRYGLLTRFEYNDKILRLIIVDDWKKFDTSHSMVTKVDLSKTPGMHKNFSHIKTLEKLVPKEYVLKAAHWDNVDNTFHQEKLKLKKSFGKKLWVREDIEDEKDAQRVIHVLYHCNAWPTQYYELTSSHPLRPADRVEVNQNIVNPLSSFKPSIKRLRVIDVQHSAQWKNKAFEYTNTAILIDDWLDYHLPIIDRAPIEHLTAWVDKPKEQSKDSAYIESDGYYRIRFDFDKHSSPLNGSPPIRTRLLGANHTIEHHHPLLPGTKVIIGFFNGVIERPFIIGAIPNQAIPQIKMKKEAVFQNAKGAGLEYSSSTIEKENQIATQKALLKMKSNYGNQSISFHHDTDGGELNVSNSKGDIQFISQNNINITATNCYATTQNLQMMHKESNYISQKIILQGDFFEARSQQQTQDKNLAKSVEIAKENSFHLDIKELSISSNKNIIESKALSIESKNANYFSKFDNFNLNSSRVKLKGNKTIKIRCGLSSITFTATGEILVQAPIVKINAIPMFPTIANTGVYVPTLPEFKIFANEKQDNSDFEQKSVKNYIDVEIGYNFGKSSPKMIYYQTNDRVIELELNEGKGRIFLSEAELQTKEVIFIGEEFLCPKTHGIVYRLKFVLENHKVYVMTVLPSPMQIRFTNDCQSDDYFDYINEPFDKKSFIEQHQLKNFIPRQQLMDLKKSKGIVTLFIHGFNVKQTNFQSHFPFEACRSVIDMKKKVDGFNGHKFTTQEGAANWMTLMEYYLNLGSGMPMNDFRQYQRIIGVSWIYNQMYLKSENNTKWVTVALASIVKELINLGIKVNIVAHSMGCRIALGVANQLGYDTVKIDRRHEAEDNGKKQSKVSPVKIPLVPVCRQEDYTERKKYALNGLVLWQPAVPNYAFSTNPYKDISLYQNNRFPFATHGAKNILVLTSKKDMVLHTLYSAGYIIDISLATGERGKYCNSKYKFVLLQWENISKLAQEYFAHSHKKLLIELDKAGDIVFPYKPYLSVDRYGYPIIIENPTQEQKEKIRLVWVWTNILFGVWRLTYEGSGNRYCNRMKTQLKLFWVGQRLQEAPKSLMDDFLHGMKQYILNYYYKRPQAMGYEFKVPPEVTNVQTYQQAPSELSGHSKMLDLTSACLNKVVKAKIMALLEKF